MKKYFYIISYKQGEKRRAIAETINDGNNILPILNRKLYNGATPEIVQPAPTRTEAEQIADFWNFCYKNNNSFMEY